MDTVSQATDLMKMAGIKVTTNMKEDGDELVYTIRIKKKSMIQKTAGEFSHFGLFHETMKHQIVKWNHVQCAEIVAVLRFRSFHLFFAVLYYFFDDNL